jgi:ankyrin repeat protein
MNLIRASAKGDLAVVKKFLAEGAEVNGADGSGRTPLIEAAWGGHADLVKYLVDKGAEVNAADNAGYTALMRACEIGNVPIITCLINKGASVNTRGKVRGTTPLMLAAEQGHIKVLELLISRGAKINAVDQFEESACARAYRANQTKAAQYLESKGGRGKPERSSLSHYSSRDKEGKPVKTVLPQWSAAAEDINLEEGEAEPAAPEGAEEAFEE